MKYRRLSVGKKPHIQFNGITLVYGTLEGGQAVFRD